MRKEGEEEEKEKEKEKGGEQNGRTFENPQVYGGLNGRELKEQKPETHV